MKKNNALPSYSSPPKPPMKKEYEMMFKILNNAESYSNINQECEKAELRMLIDYIEDYIKLKK